MKKLASIIGIASILSLGAIGQTNTPTPTISFPGLSLDWINNIPLSTNMASEKITLSTGVETVKSEVANYINLKYNWSSLFESAVEMQNAPVSTVVKNITIYPIGVHKLWTGTSLSADIAARREFVTTSALKTGYQTGLLLNADWYPFTGGRFALEAGANFMYDWSIHQVNIGARAGAKVGF